MATEFHGEPVKLDELAPGMAIEVLEGQDMFHPAFKRIGIVKRVSPHPFSKEIRTLEVSGWRGKTFASRSASIRPDQIKLKKLTGRMGSELQERYRVDLHNNFSTHLGIRLGMTIGADPEFFVFADGKLIPAWDFLTSKKQAAGQPFWDGFQAEITPSQAGCLDVFSSNTRHMLMAARQAAVSLHKGAQIVLVDSVEVPAEVLRKATKTQVALACDPSKNIYEGDQPEFVIGDPRDLNYRFAGGHMHFGIPFQRDLVLALDRIMGVMSVSMFEGMEGNVRRKLYGRAGEYRTWNRGGAQGFEYRVLGPAWLAAPGIMHLTFDMARYAITIAAKGLLSEWETTDDETRHIINEYDVDAARKVLQRNQHVVEAMLRCCYGGARTNPRALRTILNGVLSEFVLRSVYQEWQDARRSLRWTAYAARRNKPTAEMEAAA